MLTVVIVHWNQPNACIETVRLFAADPLVTRVIVVDNGSKAEAVSDLRHQADSEHLDAEVQLIEIGHNSGFGPGVNRGWESWLSDTSGTEWVAVAPHDAQPQAGALAALLAVGETTAPNGRPYGLVSADVGDAEAPFVDHVFGPITRPASTTEGVELVDYPHGTLFLASRTCLNRIGLFDERFFSYCEEADLGLRAKAAGFEVGLVRGARVVNPHVNSPTPLVDYLQERNTVLLVEKHFGRRRSMMRFALTIWQLARGIVQPSSRGPYWNTKARVQAVADITRRSWGRPPSNMT